MKEKNKNTISTIVVVVLFAIGIGIAYHTWTLGDDESDYEKICIHGHEYWRANFSNKGFLGIRLDDDGKPIACSNYGN